MMHLAQKRETLASKLYSDEPLPAPQPTKRRERSGWRRLARLGALCILSITVVVIAYLSLCTRIVEEQYGLDRVQAGLPPLREENTQLEIRVKALSTLSRVDRIARTRLGMVYPKERLIIVEQAQATAQKPAPFFAWRLGTGKKIFMP